MLKGSSKLVRLILRRTARGVAAVLLIHLFVAAQALCQDEEGTLTFEIKAYMVEGNSLLSEEELSQALLDYTGEKKTSVDVENAREHLEKIYHERGYPTVLVNIPEQTVDSQIVKLQVIESIVNRVKVTGNRYYTKENLLSVLTSFREGEILYLPKVQKELARINQGRDLSVTPLLSPGRKFGTIDIELVVEDHFPFHGSLEVNNRGTHDTTDLRMNAMLRYDNLWQKHHSVSLQYQTSPEDFSQVKVAALSYLLPAPWNKDQTLAAYGIWSDSELAFGADFNVIGKGRIFGMRLVNPLPVFRSYSHYVTIGFDLKDFDETVGFLEESDRIDSPITYAPLTAAYSGALPDRWGHTRFSGQLSGVSRELVSARDEFEIKRYRARGNYLVLSGGIERIQELPKGMNLLLKLDGQLADQPLISNEQYSAGGMDSVRGYKESEKTGDDALHATAELVFPDLAPYLRLESGTEGRIGAVPYLFYDGAAIRVKEPLEGEDPNAILSGYGIGVRGNVTKWVQYRLEVAVARTETDRTDPGDVIAYFSIKAEF